MASWLRGPSPRARGSRARGLARRAGAGSIPASAGKPPSPARPPRTRSVHPRERGEAARTKRGASCARGPSPRARGSPLAGMAREGGKGSIPASAGKPPICRSRVWPRAVHPRERGEATMLRSARIVARGPSPRARGSPSLGAAADASHRSIPASAGKPDCEATPSDQTRVHPRERGEATREEEYGWLGQGPSPRARGSLTAMTDMDDEAGSIPASAGKPAARRAATRSGRVHPRERGEATFRGSTHACGWGPSPRARGSRDQLQRKHHLHGSIPASAGKPLPRRVELLPRRVHPRERGEARTHPPAQDRGQGPSPRARGSRLPAGAPDRREGSIPASAGKPPRSAPGCATWRVHPRERGEAASARSGDTSLAGPSPRARGSPNRRSSAEAGARSIPASAGKPPGSPVRRCTSRVHPRERGEAWRPVIRSQLIVGPSPRARGSRVRADSHLIRVRSIPASAGKPAPLLGRRRFAGVHPRERGEAQDAAGGRLDVYGPSPRARGSRFRVGAGIGW